MQLTTYTLFQIIPRMETWLQSPPETLKQYRHDLENIDGEEQERIARIEKELQQISTQILDLMTKGFETFIESIPEQIATAAEDLRFEHRISRQEREDIIIDWFNQWLQQALHHFTQQNLRRTMETAFSDLKVQIDSIRLEHIVAIDNALKCDSDEIQLFSGRWIEETSLLITTALSLMLLKIDRERVAKDLLKVRALRGWLMGSTLSMNDRAKLAKQLQQTLSTEKTTMMSVQKEHIDQTITSLKESLKQELCLTRVDAFQQIDTVLKLHSTDKRDTPLEQQQLQLETLRLSVHNMHSQLRTMMNNL